MKKNILAGALAGAGLFLAGAGFWISCENFSGGDNFPTVSRECADFAAAFPISLGEKKLALRLALTDLERRQGLTGCRGLPENSGMLFVYADSAPRGFWMRGVPVGLSVGFLDSSGTLLETHEMRANDTETTFSRARNVQFALEMPSGWFTENGIVAGTRLDLADLVGAVAARGFSPEKFGISAKK